MVAQTEHGMNEVTDEGLLVGLVTREGALTIEQTMETLDMSWEDVFRVVDRLSRTGAIRLTRVGGTYYLERTGTA